MFAFYCEECGGHDQTSSTDNVVVTFKIVSITAAPQLLSKVEKVESQAEVVWKVGDQFHVKGRYDDYGGVDIEGVEESIEFVNDAGVLTFDREGQTFQATPVAARCCGSGLGTEFGEDEQEIEEFRFCQNNIKGEYVFLEIPKNGAKMALAESFGASGKKAVVSGVKRSRNNDDEQEEEEEECLKIIQTTFEEINILTPTN